MTIFEHQEAIKMDFARENIYNRTRQRDTVCGAYERYSASLKEEREREEKRKKK